MSPNALQTQVFFFYMVVIEPHSVDYSDACEPIRDEKEIKRNIRKNKAVKRGTFSKADAWLAVN